MLLLETSLGPLQVDLDRIAEVLQPAAHVPYAPPHVFPMSTPTFTRDPERERPRPGRKPLGVYIHIPFCSYACNFCFYVKQIGASRDDMERYVHGIRRELQALPQGAPLAQLYIGGGTPSALPPHLLDSVLAAVFGRVARSCESVHTVECSPETLTPDHLGVLANHHVQRVSMGIQTLRDEILATVHRRHSAKEAIDAMDLLVESGRTVNVDLIYGLPGQAEEDFRQDFKEIAARGVHSVNAYSLRVNERTPVLRLLRDEERLELSRLIRWRAVVRRTAEELGYRQTHWQRFMREGSAFELDLTSDHLFAAGVSARSFLDDTVYRNISTIPAYLSRIESGCSPVEEIFRLDDEHRKTYFVTRTLGAGKALDMPAFQRRFGCSFLDVYGSIVERLEDNGLITEKDNHLSMTATGTLVYDLITLAFYPQPLQEWLEDRHALAIRRRSPQPSSLRASK
jgi:oxygen-independent coproporphyrinogen-3 oxidase